MCRARTGACCGYGYDTVPIGRWLQETRRAEPRGAWRGRKAATRQRSSAYLSGLGGWAQDGVARTGEGVGKVPRVVQAATFLALERAADDEIGRHHEVAQLDQVVAHAEIRVELVDFA